MTLSSILNSLMYSNCNRSILSFEQNLSKAEFGLHPLHKLLTNWNTTSNPTATEEVHYLLNNLATHLLHTTRASLMVRIEKDI